MTDKNTHQRSNNAIILKTFKGKLDAQKKLIVLSEHLRVSPSEIEIALNPHGKPFLKKPRTMDHFNISHSADYTLVAFSHTEVGVDLEKFRTNLDREKIGARLFSQQLCKWIESFTVNSAWHAFFKAWTFYEAFLKCKGLTIFSGETIKEKFIFQNLDQKSLILENITISEIKTPTNYFGAVASSIENPDLIYSEE